MKDTQDRLRSWMRAGVSCDFETLARCLFAQQFGANRVYRKYCEWLGATPATVGDWREIPAVPTDAFKSPQHRLRGFPEGRVTRRFLTSGTTREVRGCHEFATMEWYEESILGAWRELGMPTYGNPWFLARSPEAAPDSSLSYMFGTLLKESGAVGDRWLMDVDGRMDVDGLRGANSPVALFSTAIALLRCAEQSAPLKLPEGSWIFETGGYKGESIRLEPEEFRAQVSRHFGVPVDRIFNEYSMTELSSQFYRKPGERDHHGPPWTRVRVVDVESGRLAAAGEVGYLEIVDLANVGSVMAIRTQDFAIRRGDSSFTLLGRDPGAVARGCSRGADRLISGR